MHHPKNWKPAGGGSCPRDMIDATIRKKYKSDHNLSEKNKIKSQAFHLCAHAVPIRGKRFRSSSQNWAGHRSNATCSRHYLANEWEPFFGGISWWATNWAVQLISIVSLCVQDYPHQVSPWSKTRIVRAVTRIVCRNVGAKIAIFEFSWISPRDRGIFSKCLNLHTCIHFALCQGQCFQFSSHSLQRFTRYDFKNCSLNFGWPSSYDR